MNIEITLEKLIGLWFCTGMLSGILLGLFISWVARKVCELTVIEGGKK
jgi:hypothetical protein